jgi:hypothetical protein
MELPHIYDLSAFTISDITKSLEALIGVSKTDMKNKHFRPEKGKLVASNIKSQYI